MFGAMEARVIGTKGKEKMRMRKAKTSLFMAGSLRGFEVENGSEDYGRLIHLAA
jgi:hypothetical protein